ncbi:14453_t:CDS:2, partial [Dentiscutata erythropus]
RGSLLERFTVPLAEDIAALRPRDIVNRVRSEVGAEASYMAAWRSRAANKRRRAAKVDENYQRIKPLLDNLLLANPGSIIAFEINANNRFERAFLCLWSWIKAAEHCIHVFTLDACHSKSNYKGVYLSASVVDGEGKLVPIAFAVCSVENSNNWMWFCEHLCIALSRMNSNETVIISDREKTKLGGKIWAAAKALHIKDFDDIMEEIFNMHTEAATYLNEIPHATWTLSKCPRNRFGHLTSNASESLNSWLYDERLVEPFDAIILFVRKVNTLYYDRRTAYSSVQTILPQMTTQRLQSVINGCRSRMVYQINESIFE